MAWAPAYLSREELIKAYNITDSVDDVALDLAIETASRAVDQDCNRQFGVVASAEQRFYTGHWDKQRCRWVVPMDDLMSTSNFAAITVDSDGVTIGTITDYVMEPRNAAAKGRPWEQLLIRPNSTVEPTGREDEVALTGLWGWTAIPDTIVMACQLQANRFFARRKSPFGVAGSPDIGSELRLLAKVDPDVAVAIRPYRRWWAGA